jgi:hypothetical protein
MKRHLLLLSQYFDLKVTRSKEGETRLHFLRAGVSKNLCPFKKKNSTWRFQDGG